MIQYDKINNQILSSSCLTCKDECFQPPNKEVPKVGCCSYSPTFYLLEISNMIHKDETFFLEAILSNPKSQISPFHITVPANIHPSYSKTDSDLDLSPLEEDDLRHSHSICQFFKNNQGCTLHPSFKNSVCRSFVCLSIEDHLNEREKQPLQAFTHYIKKEESNFQRIHEQQLRNLNADLQTSPVAVINYFKSLKKTQ
ncbi:hypothetical protein N0O92_10275 [Alkalihalobacillus sp. MEB130]|uniref:hypothetical protein n=1 Tax=Alkalihalobacillus sp. MEB130 TaxID=2976704 RepID=UPI0028DF7D05|nr:hypothetical protein [Alkalihalobacillus sp. MEB130]MDT8860620.1 hypothetical protein [Alkalihalobacillus sp. MEB130]